MREPTLTEMSVAKPWMDSSPAPSTSQTLGGDPGLEFSQAILLPLGPHGSAAAAGPDTVTAVRTDDTSTRPSTPARTRTRRPRILLMRVALFDTTDFLLSNVCRPEGP